MATPSGEFIMTEENLMDKTPMSAQDTVEVISTEEQVEAEESPEELDLHVCGKCKTEFTNIQLYVDHKRMVCSKRSPTKTGSQESPTKAKKPRPSKQIISSTNAVTAIIEPQEDNFCETVIEEGVIVDEDATEENQHEIIKAAKASENQDATEKAKEKKTKAVTRKLETEALEAVAISSLGPGPFLCNVCDKEFDRPETLVVHQFMHKKFHQCTDCKRSFVSEENLNKHKKEFKHVFKCKICVMEFGSQDLCKAHEASHTRQHECIDCKKKFYTEKTLERHRDKVLHNLPCEHCGKICRDKHALTKHQESHTRVKSHICDWEACDRGFRSASELTKHKKCVHLGIKEHKCIECGKEFARKDKLNRHLLIHSPNRPTYPCPFKTFTGCVKTFYRKDKLQRHIFAHSKEKPYKCDTCNKLFARKDNLTEHIRIHTGEFKHRCPVCNKGMGGPKKLLLHVKQKHSGLNETIPEKPTMVTTALPTTSQEGTVTIATADATAVTWVQENITGEEKMQEEATKSSSTPESCSAEICYENERGDAQVHDEDQPDEHRPGEHQQITIEIHHQPVQQPSTQAHVPPAAQVPHDKDVPQRAPAQRRQHQPMLPPPQQRIIQQLTPPTQNDQPTQHNLQPQTMVVHQQPPASAPRVAVHYLSNTNPSQARAQYVTTALPQGVANVTQSETALLHEVLSELATRSLFNP